MSAAAHESEPCPIGICSRSCQCSSLSLEDSPPPYESLSKTGFQTTGETDDHHNASNSRSDDRNLESNVPKDPQSKHNPRRPPREYAFFRQMLRQFHEVRRSYRNKRLADTPAGFAREKLRAKELLLSLKIRVAGVYWYDGGGFEEAAQENAICALHRDNQCYCIGFCCRPQTPENRTIYIDWKPFALGKHERMKRGEECDVHGGLECCCWLEPFERELENEKGILCLYDLKNSWRERICMSFICEICASNSTFGNGNKSSPVGAV